MQTEFARNGADIGRQMLTIGICRDGPRNSRDLFQEIRKGSLESRTFAAVEPVDKNRSTKRAARSNTTEQDALLPSSTTTIGPGHPSTSSSSSAASRPLGSYAGITKAILLSISAMIKWILQHNESICGRRL